MKEQSRTWSSSQPGGQYTRSKTALLAWEVSLAVDVGYRMKDRVHVSCSRQPALTRGKELFGTIGWREDSAGPLPSACGNRSFVRSRSEERRVGKECVSKCRFRWWQDN